jgi:predicted secreted protein
VEFRYGNNAAPTSGDPKITGEFVVSSYKVMAALDGKMEFEVTLVIGAGSSLPTWGTVS